MEGEKELESKSTEESFLGAPGSLRTEAEQVAGKNIEAIFLKCPDSVEIKLENFTKYVRRQKITRLLAQYEIFKQVLTVKGSVIECGVHRGASLMAWAQLSAVLEPVNLTRRIYGFDTFSGFSSVHPKDRSEFTEINAGSLYADTYDELNELIEVYDSDRFIGHINKIELVKGDAVATIPEFIKTHQHLVVSILFLDFDLYEPTKVAIENFFPRMPKGAVIAFDELDNPLWPGETTALLETIGINHLEIQRVEFDPYIGYALIG
jgi:hypothetical protein